jgi:hypothetical protein
MNEYSRVSDVLHGRLFKGILLHADIESMEERGLLVPQDTALEKQSIPFLGKYKEYFGKALRDRCEQMTHVYTLFYCFENDVRELVSQRLQERKGGEWWTTSVPKKVQERVEKRKADVADNPWHQANFDANIDHTLFGDLASIIVEQWQDFEELFPNQNWVKQRLDELERSRNVIAHGNLLAGSEIERIEQYLDDWLRQVP